MLGESHEIFVLDTNSAGNGTRAMEAAHQRGLRPVFLARNPAEYEHHDPSPLDVAAEVIEVETLDVVKTMASLTGRPARAVLAFDELRIVQAALIGEWLEVPYGPSPRSVLTVRFKQLLRTALSNTRWATRFCVGAVEEDLRSNDIPFPAVLKPTDEAASVGVQICRNRDDLRVAVNELKEIASRPNGRGYRLTGEYLVEELLTGREYSAEMVWSRDRGRWVTLGFTTKEFAAPPYAVELAHTFPFRFGQGIDETISEDLNELLTLVGLAHTAAHVEFCWDGERLRLIEINPRPAGGEISELVRLAGAISFADFFLAAHLGAADELLQDFTPDRFARVGFLLPPRPGVITGFSSELAPDQHLAKVRFAKTPLCAGRGASNEEYIARVVAVGKTPAEAETAVADALSNITPVYADVEPEVAGTAPEKTLR
jgi:hypothetical protein